MHFLNFNGTYIHLHLFRLRLHNTPPHEIEPKFSSPLTSTNKFKQYIAGALQGTRAICEAGELQLKSGQEIGKESVPDVLEARL